MAKAVTLNKRRWIGMGTIFSAAALTAAGTGASAAFAAEPAAMAVGAPAASQSFGPSNPFFAPSPLPFQSPPFDRIHDSDFQPAIEAGMAQQRTEIDAIANNPEAPTFANTAVALEHSGQLLQRVMLVFGALAQANTNPTLQTIQEQEAPKLAAQNDYLFLNPKLFSRMQVLYGNRQHLQLDPESLRLLEWTYQHFVLAGAKLNDADKTQLKC